MKRSMKERLALIKKGMGVGAVAMKAILAGKDVEATIAAVKKAFPKAKTGRNSVLWYRSELRRLGEKVPPLAWPGKATEKAAPKKRQKKEGKGRRVDFRAVPPGTVEAAATERKAAAQ